MTAQTRVVAGRVRTDDGSAIVGARIYFLSGPGPLPDVAALTDSRGAFSLGAPHTGVYKIGCTTEGYASASADVTVTGTSGAFIEFVVKKLNA